MKAWIKAAAIRAVKTVAQTAIAMIGTGVVLSDIDWRYLVSAVILAGILSILTSIAGLPEVNAESASIVSYESNGKDETE